MGLPKAVSETFEKLRSRHKHLGISVINGKFYVSASTKRLVKATGAYRTFSLYMGRILDDGAFIEARHRKAGTAASSVEALIKSRTGSADKGTEAALDDADRYILESLSTDAKKSEIEVARELDMSAAMVNYRIKKLEKEFGIRYMAEVPTSAFGFSRFAVMVKFRGTAPNPALIREELGKSPFVNVALMTKGSYDLFMIVVAENTLKLEAFIYALRTSDTFSPYRSVWNVSYLGLRYGFIPLRESFFNTLESHVWRRSRESPSKLPNQLLEREYIVLKELSLDGSREFSEIDKKYGFGKGASQYTYHRLVEKGMISRITIAMDRPPLKYVALLHLDQINMRRFAESSRGLFLDRIGYSENPIDRYTIAGDFGSPYGIFLMAPISDDSGLYAIERSVMASVKGIRIRSLVVTGVVAGRLGFRKFDNSKSEAYAALKERYKYSEDELQKIMNKNKP